MKSPSFDIDLDKHYNATMVLACDVCGHEQRVHMKALAPDTALTCDCGHSIAMSPAILNKAMQKVSAIKAAYQVR